MVEQSVNHGGQSTCPAGLFAIVSLRVLKPGGFVSFQGRTCFARKPLADPPAFSPETGLLGVGPEMRENQIGLGLGLVLNVLSTERLNADRTEQTMIILNTRL